MKSISRSKNIDSYGAANLCLIVGLTCLAGFALDLLALGLPPQLFEVQWRINFFQQVGDRSILLLFGAALTMYGSFGNRRLLRKLALTCLIIGVVFNLSCLLTIQDSLTLKTQAINNISNQMVQVRAQVEEAQDNSDLPPNITPEQIEQAYQQIASQADSLKQNAQMSITKAAIVSLGNLLIVGLGLVSLGRFGLSRT